MAEKLTQADQVIYQGHGFVITPNTVTLGHDAWAVRNIASVHPRFQPDRQTAKGWGVACLFFALIMGGLAFLVHSEGTRVALIPAGVGCLLLLIGLYFLFERAKTIPLLIINAGGAEHVAEFKTESAMRDVLQAITRVMSESEGHTISATQINVYKDERSIPDRRFDR